MSVHRLKIESDSIAAVQVYPTWSGDVEYSRENDGVFFRAKPNGDFQFKKSEYTTIKGVPDCEKIDLFLEEKCDDVWIERWRGRFTTYDVKFNENKCLANVSPKTSDEFDCFLSNWEVEQVISGAGDPVSVYPFAGSYEVGQCCGQCFDVEPDPEVPVCATPANWCFDSTYQTGSSIECLPDIGFNLYVSCFHRIIGQGTPSVPPPYGTGWAHISGDDWWRCPDTDNDLGVGVFDQGRLFNDVLEYLADQTGCGLTVRSHFLGLNATHDAPPSNLAYTFATEFYQDLQIHQKSDIKRPDATNPAQSFVWKMSFKRLLEDRETIWQVFWTIDGTDLIIEHISYFEANTGVDVTTKNIKLEYGKQEGGAPNEETFRWADGDATFTLAQAGYPISYGNCGEGTTERKVNYFSNDVYYIRSTSNPEEIADAGFCLVATEVIDGKNTIIDSNDPMGWVQIHENLFQHNRFFAEGVLNDAPATFLSTRKTRKLEPFKITVCCGDNFNPADSIETLVGTSYVQKTTANYFAGVDTNLITIEANI